MSFGRTGKTEGIEVFIAASEFVQDFEGLMNLTKKEATRALYRAVNRATGNSRTRIIRQVREKYSVKHGSVFNRMSLHRATTSNLHAEIQIKGKPISLHRFGVPKFSKKNRPARGLSVEIIKGEKELFEGSFFGRVNGQRLILRRLGYDRHPLEMLYGPSPAELVDDTIIEKSKAEAVTTFYKTFAHEVEQGHRYAGSKIGKYRNK
jgi:hypothetical protein